VIEGEQRLRTAYQDDRVAREYIAERFRSPFGALLHARQVHVVRKLIRTEAIEGAVELAPGPARLTVDIAPALRRVTLLDSSAQMLSEARRRLADRGLSDRVSFLQADAFRLPLRGQSRLVYSFRLIRHFERDDRIRLYRQIASILAPGGWLVFDAINRLVSAPARNRARPGEFEHFDALLRPDELRQELGESGFEVVSLIGAQRRYRALMTSQIYLAPRSAVLARAAMEIIDRLGGEPLEWIVQCRRA
jgi:SAM-dependent methyltransferase